tara:strand:- start:5047 stop:5856 length:810 start_codon:yes stop_codon:yes gene_type:complete
MAYPKITVNTGQALIVVPSDTIPIPNPNFIAATGVGNVVVAGTANGNVVNELVDTTKDFLSTVTPLPVIGNDTTGDLAYETGSGNSAVVQTAGVATTVLTLASDIFPLGTEPYKVIRPLSLIDDEVDFVAKGVKAGDIVLNTDAGTIATVTAVVNSDELTLSAGIFGTLSTYDDNFRIYSQAEGLQNYPAYLGTNGAAAIGSNNEGCLIYVGDSTAATTIETSHYNVVVRTVGGDIVTFHNFPVGNYLPVQCVQVLAGGTTADKLIAIW